MVNWLAWEHFLFFGGLLFTVIFLKMLILLPIEKLEIKQSFDQDFTSTINALQDSFVFKYGMSTFNMADKIVILEKKFYHILKDKYGPQIVGEYLDENTFDDIIDSYLTLN